MSGRAAARLEALGFDPVFDYVGGKMGWLDSGLAVDGDRAARVRTGGLVRRNPPSLHPESKLADVLESDVREWGMCVVVDENNVVHGLLGSQVAEGEKERSAEEVMELGPTTIRPSRSIADALDLMDETDSDTLLVTSPYGELIGVLYRADVEDHLDSR